MKRYLVMSLLLLLTVLGSTIGKEKRVLPSELQLYATLNQSSISNSGGTVYLQVEVVTPHLRTRERTPMNLAVVLDRSGSMADERKLEYAKTAIKSLIDKLTEDDYLSLVIYDHTVSVLTPLRRVTDKRRLKRLISDVTPGGQTNLGGGMIEGYHQLESRIDREYVNRVILLSDGLANKGIISTEKLNSIVSQYRAQSISLTTIGVGLDYNENLMLSMAENGGGSYYYIESPSQLAGMFERELNGLSGVVAQNATLELKLGNDITLIDVIGCKELRIGGTRMIALGDLYSGERRELTLELSIPEGSGKRFVASGILNFDSRVEGLRKQPKFSVDIRYSNDITELERSKNWDIQGKVDVAVSTKKVEQAIQSLDAGDVLKAQQTLETATSQLRGGRAMQNSAVAAPLMHEQVLRLEELSKELKDDSKDERAKKKSIQYQNYMVQKKKP